MKTVIDYMEAYWPQFVSIFIVLTAIMLFNLLFYLYRKRINFNGNEEKRKVFFQKINSKQIINNMVPFLKFGLVGISNTLIALLVYYIFILINKDWYMIGQVASWIISVANSFYWNNRYVFPSNKKSFKDTMTRMLKTYISYGSVFLLTCLMLWFEIEILKISEFISPIINIVLTIPLNFLINKYWAFKQKPGKRSEDETTTG